MSKGIVNWVGVDDRSCDFQLGQLDIYRICLFIGVKYCSIVDEEPGEGMSCEL